jgi:hypothetical protein
MKRDWNGLIWAGFAVIVLSFFSYVPIFVRFPETRDMPWVNLLLFAVGLCMLAMGTARAYGRPERYRGRVSGVVLGMLGLAIVAAFCWGSFVFARRVPVSSGAPRLGQQAPDFTLTDTAGKPVALSQLRQANRGVLLVFYRGYW